MGPMLFQKLVQNLFLYHNWKLALLVCSWKPLFFLFFPSYRLVSVIEKLINILTMLSQIILILPGEIWVSVLFWLQLLFRFCLYKQFWLLSHTDSFNLLVNNGAAAGQVIFHVSCPSLSTISTNPKCSFA